MLLTDIQQYVKELVWKNNWGSEDLTDRLAYLDSEIKEMLDEMDKFDEATTSIEKEEIRTKLGHEIFDIIWNLAEIANRYNIDLDIAAQQKIEINSTREEFSLPEDVKKRYSENKDYEITIIDAGVLPQDLDAWEKDNPDKEVVSATIVLDTLIIVHEK